MVAPVSAQISTLPPRLLAAPLRRRSLPVVTTHHPLPPVFRPSLCFHALTNPSSRKPFIFTSIQIPRGCGGTSLQSPSQLCASVTNPLLSCSCSLFVASFHKTPGVGGVSPIEFSWGRWFYRGGLLKQITNNCVPRASKGAFSANAR